MENFTLETFLSLVNTGAIVLFLYLFITGKVVSEKIVNRILEEADNRASKQATEIADKIQNAVKMGVLEAHAKPAD